MRAASGRRAETEHQEQAALFQWAGYARRERPELEVLFAIPNGGHRRRGVAGRMKAEGARAGVPDVCLPVARAGVGGGGFNALWIEMKTKTGALSPQQRRWRDLVTRHGGAYRICRSWIEAMETILAYLDGRFPCNPE